MHQTNTPSATPQWIYSGPAACHHPVLGCFLLVILTDGLRAGLSIEWPSRWAWLTMVVWLPSGMSLLVGLARRLPLQNVVAVAIMGGLVGFGVNALDASTGIPFGPRQFQEGSGPHLFDVPALLPFLWLTLLLCGRGIARLIFKRHRTLAYYGFWVLGLAATLVTTEMVLVEPTAARLNWWRWIEPGGWVWQGVPLVNWLGCWVTSLLLLAFLTPWLLNKRPVPQPVDVHPLVISLALAGWMAVDEIVHSDIPSLAINLTAHLAVSFAVWRGSRPGERGQTCHERLGES